MGIVPDAKESISSCNLLGPNVGSDCSTESVLLHKTVLDLTNLSHFLQLSSKTFYNFVHIHCPELVPVFT